MLIIHGVLHKMLRNVMPHWWGISKGTAAAAAAKSLQALPSLGFSRQEHWSGSPFPSPMHESKKGK